MQNDEQIAPLKQPTVDLLLRLAPRGWKRVFCDYEWHEGSHQFVSSEVTIAVVKKLFGGVESVALDLARDGRVITNFLEIARLATHAKGTHQCTICLIVRGKSDHDWQVDFSPPPRLSAKLAGDLEAVYRNPDMKKRYRIFAAQDEWLAKIP